ncbi:MAG: UvrD-helicase domain-containing protein [Treponema sp.]|nr:UvrD-helicase domain-containing protein [Treponema sp.]
MAEGLGRQEGQPSYLDCLNEEQRAAVVHEGSPLLILAGAGSGKTRVITTKIAYLISQKHVDPYSILAVTFTKKAANEMRERAAVLEPRSQYAQIRTFHSWGSYFLRTHAFEAGVDKNFTVYDDDDMTTLLQKAVPELTKQQAKVAAKKISLAKDFCLEPDSERLYMVSEDPKFPSIYTAYQTRLRETGNVDFGDLIMLPYMVLRDNASARRDVQLRYRVILVDEYQDSNTAQFLLLQQLSGVQEGAPTYVCVVGDDDQSIYKFRGADVQNILGFQTQFPGTTLIRLQTNYRSTSEILACADSVVKNNEGRLGKTLVSDRGKGKKPTLVFLPNQDDEPQFCAQIIKQAHSKGVPYSAWAVLYRMNAQSLGFETEFLHSKIPYVIVGSLKFYEREEIKDALAWISFVSNQKDEVSFRRIVNKPARGIGGTTQDKVVDAFLAGEAGVEQESAGSLLDESGNGVAAVPQNGETLLSESPDAEGRSLTKVLSSLKLSKKAREGADSFCALVREFEAMLDGSAETEKLSSFIKAVMEKSGLQEYHRDQDDVAGTQKEDNLQELVNSALLYPCTRDGLTAFMDSIQLDRSLANEDGEGEDDRVTLITLHNTKGLEFPRVIITGMEAGVFPREDKCGDELEEERRLFYVGITRAKDELYFTSCQMRRLYGSTRYTGPSPFLPELGGKNVRVLGNTPSSFSFDSAFSAGGDDDELARKYCAGAEVYHDDWGYGHIIKGGYSAEREYVISVKFQTGTVKKFLPKYQGSALIVSD